MFDNNNTSLLFELFMVMKVCEIEQYIESQYNQLKAYKYKANSQILYNLIQVKAKMGVPNYKQSLYLDVKKFTEAYIKASDKLDYGYDEILISKLLSSVSVLEGSQQISILYNVRRMMWARGYDTDCLLYEIKKIERKIAWSGNARQKIYAVCLWISATWWALIVSYFVYIILLGFVLLPAPLDCMQLFTIEFKPLNSNNVINHILNTLGLMTGNENISPKILPIGIMGMGYLIIGKILFYLIIANFIYRKLEEYITLK